MASFTPEEMEFIKSRGNTVRTQPCHVVNYTQHRTDL